MEKKIELINAGEATYLSEVMEDLPDNCIFNKVLTGVGATTVALANDVPYVIAVPYLNLVESIKTWAKENDRDLLFVYGGVSFDEIKEYRGKKIVTTWDSLSKVLEVIEPKEWKLLVDEYHTLLEAASFRRSAIDKVLNSFKEFKSYVFMTATPLEDRYQIDELKDLRKVVMTYDTVQKIGVTWSAFTGNLTDHLYLQLRKHLTGELLENAHIFINSVSLITKTLKQLKKNNKEFLSDFRVVCANNPLNQSKLHTVSRKINISSVSSEVKKLNFYTSTAFEGCNIYDENSVSYVVTDGHLDHTKINLFTTLPQIVGRIRDSINKNNILILYTPDNTTTSLTEEQFESTVQEDLETAGSIVEQYNIVKNMNLDKAVGAFKESSVNKAFVYTNEEDEIVVNNLYWKSQMHMFSTLHKVYYVKNVNNYAVRQTENKLYTIVFKDLQKHSDISSLDKLKLDKKPKYTDLFKTYINLCTEYKTLEKTDCKKNAVQEEIELIEIHYPEFRTALKTLGADKIRALSYQKSKIKKEMLLVNAKSKCELKIVELLAYKTGSFISSFDIKNQLQVIYDRLNLDKVATATQIEEYYKVKSTDKKIDGNQTRGYEILYPLYK